MGNEARNRTMARGAFIIIMALFTVAGCGKTGRTLAQGSTAGYILIRPLHSPDPALLKEMSFYAEYLLESKNNFERVAVFIEPLKTPAAIILNPGAYVSGQTGAETIGDLPIGSPRLGFTPYRPPPEIIWAMPCCAPARPFAPFFIRKGRYWLELSRKK